ncbi:MAG: aldose 1-epimerase [Novosphingobium sp.]
MLNLVAGDYRLALDPLRGGSLAALTWRGEALLRPTCGPSILDTACFPLVPFSNRIANGKFTVGGREVCVAANMPGSDHPHPMHGFGWLTEWRVVTAAIDAAVLEHHHQGGEWPWPYRARQTFALSAEGATFTLALENLGVTPMPAGLGFHPYFPRDADTRYLGLHRGEWKNSPDCLPVSLDEKVQAADWWQGAPVSSRLIDTAYTSREGALQIDWPSRGLGLTITPSDNLPFTVVYTPEGEEYFCVEPVSHMTDAVNSTLPDSGLRWLEPGATMTITMQLTAHTFSQE